MQDYVWQFLNNSKVDTLDELLPSLLKNRGVIDLDAFIKPPTPEKFIKDNPEFAELVENSVKKAKSIILESIANNEEIIIHGDYDVDGQTATAILWKTIYEDLGYKNARPFIPNRFNDGYGLSIASLDSIGDATKNGPALIITVDCGIVSNKEVLEAKKRGFKVIITDHHETHDKIPKANAVIHTTRATGAGISWILSNELYPKTSKDKLGLAALGTICDLQPLNGFNRSVAKYGLEQLNTSMPTGIQALSQLALVKGKIDTYEVGWLIGPRLNATGRMEDAMDSLRLLSTNSIEQAMDLAKRLNSLNTQRQEKTIKDTINAIDKIEDEGNEVKLQNFILITEKDYHEGIIGLIAGKLTQKYYMPSIVIAINEKDDIAKGSARSIPGISIIEVLRKFENLFIGIGGHEMAAGFSIKPSKIPELKEKLSKINDLDKAAYKKTLKVDMQLDSKLINIDTINEIEKLKPFGQGNYEPTFVTEEFEVINVSRFGKENDHLRLFLKTPSGNEITGLAFGKGAISDNINFKDRLDIAYNLSVNDWNGNHSLEIKIKDLKFRQN